MNKIQIEFLILVSFVLFAGEVSAFVTINIEIAPQFTIGEKISFNYMFVSDVDEEIIYVVSTDCPQAPQPLLNMNSAILEKNTPFKGEYSYIEITEYTETQNCTAIVIITEPVEMKEERSFKIITNPSFELDVLLCKNEFCMERSKVFVRDETIYLNYSSDVDSPSVTAILIYPDETTRTLTLPTSIKAEQIGTHTLNITASKQGYKDIKTQTQFGVIKQEADIFDASVCNGNGICDNQENYQNCPQDCPFPFDELSKKTKYLVIILMIIIVLFVVFLIVTISAKIFKIIRKRRFGEIKGVKKLEKMEKGIDLKKLELKKDFQKKLKEKERVFKKKERFLGKLLRRKKKSHEKEYDTLERKLKHDRELLSEKELEIKKGLEKKFEIKRKLLGLKKRELEKEEKAIRDKSQKGKVHQEIRRLLLEGRMQLSLGNKLTAKNIYRKIHKLHGSLESFEKNKELYNKILIFYKQLTR